MKKSKHAKVITFIKIILLIVMLCVLAEMVAELRKNNKKRLINRDIPPNPVSQYNAEFTMYEEYSNVKGANIRSLINNILTHNRYNSEDSKLWINAKVIIDENGTKDSLEVAEKMVTNNNGVNESSNITVEEYNKMIEKELEKVKNSRTYSVRCGYDRYSGFVVEIVVVLNQK